MQLNRFAKNCRGDKQGPLYWGPYDPTTATFMKTSLKSRLPVLALFFAIIPRGPVG